MALPKVVPTFVTSIPNEIPNGELYTNNLL